MPGNTEATNIIPGSVEDSIEKFVKINHGNSREVVGTFNYTRALDVAKNFSINSDNTLNFTYNGEEEKNINLLIDEMKNQGITNPKDQIGILATIGKETGFIPKSEYSYSNTPNDSLRELFTTRLNSYDEAALTALKKDDKKFYDVIYGPNEWNNHTEPGDGYKYRGRGFNGITFKATYEKYSDLLGVDLVNNPDLLNDPKIAARAAIMLFKNGLKNYKKTY